MNKFYITTTLPYVNSDPHIGFALEIIHADVIARYHALLGDEVFFNTGTDEHGSKIHRKAEEQGRDTQSYVDEYAEKFKLLKDRLNIFPDIHFVRTTDSHHKLAAQEFWKRCLANDDIYKKTYKIKYCVGCELEKTDSELEDDKCPIHPNMEIEFIDEENYFFRFSKYQQALLDLYKANPNFVVPSSRLGEITKFVESGLQDFSISRLREKMPWGVPVPDDDEQVMYVWFDALVNYISTIGWPEDTENFEKFWGTKENPNGIQNAGKDNLRQQSAMWQAMLLSAGLPNSKQIMIHGFITSQGQKMSKSLGNVVSPYELLEKLEGLGLSKDQAIDSLRYYLTREIPTFEDGDFTWERFVESYNANLANGIGNLTSRILKMALNAGMKFDSVQNPQTLNNPLLDELKIDKAADELWDRMKKLDEYIQQHEPFKVIKTDPERAKKDIEYLLLELHDIALSLQSFLPSTAEQILNGLQNISEENIPRLFPRITE
jgi:methionyl-tRNA synthetase